MEIFFMLEQQNKTLNRLITICEDAHDFYTNAAKQVENKQLRTIFNDTAEVHTTIISDLQSFVVINGGDIEVCGSIKGKAIQLLGRLKTVFTDTDKVLITELEELEGNALKEFEEAMNIRIQPEATRIIGKQVMLLRKTHEHLKNLKYYSENVAS